MKKELNLVRRVIEIICGVLVFHPTLCADSIMDKDNFSVPISPDFIMAQKILRDASYNHAVLTESGGYVIPAEIVEDIRTRFNQSFLSGVDEYAELLQYQEYTMDEQRAGCYQYKNSALKDIGLNNLEYGKVLGGVLRLPDEITVNLKNGDKVPAWWIGLDSFGPIVHPTKGGDYVYMNFSYNVPSKLNQCLEGWSGYSQSQRDFLLSILNRNDYRSMLYDAIFYGACEEKVTLESSMQRLKQHLGLSVSTLGGGDDVIWVRGVLHEGDSPTRYSVTCSVLGEGKWIDERFDLCGVMPVCYDDFLQRAVVNYIQTRWEVPVGAGADWRNMKIDDIRDYLELNCFRPILENLSSGATLGDFIIKYNYFLDNLDGLAHDAWGMKCGDASGELYDNLMDNPSLEYSTGEEVVDLLSKLEAFKQRILLRY